MNVYILNLEVEQKRRYMCEGALFAMNAPFKRVKRWIAKDDFEYEKSSDVIRAAIRDGFPSFQSYLDKGQQNKDGIAIYTQTWNYCRFWRYLIENNETAMLIQDDRKLRSPYPRMLEIFEELISFDPNFQFLSLWYVEKRGRTQSATGSPYIRRLVYCIRYIYQRCVCWAYRDTERGGSLT